MSFSERKKRINNDITNVSSAINNFELLRRYIEDNGKCISNISTNIGESIKFDLDDLLEKLNSKSSKYNTMLEDINTIKGNLSNIFDQLKKDLDKVKKEEDEYNRNKNKVF